MPPIPEVYLNAIIISVLLSLIQLSIISSTLSPPQIHIISSTMSPPQIHIFLPDRLFNVISLSSLISFDTMLRTLVIMIRGGRTEKLQLLFFMLSNDSNKVDILLFVTDEG